MARVEKAEQVKKRHLDDLGNDLGEVFHGLYQRVTWLQATWMEFQELFAKSPERLTLLNESAGFFFYVVQRTLWTDILLAIRRLTDSESMGKKRDNLTIRRLPGLCVDAALRVKIEGLVAKALTDCECAREWTNRTIAHADLALALGRSASALPPLDRENVDQAIGSIHDVLNAISLHLRRSHMEREPIINGDGAVSLLYVLRDGIKTRSALVERIRNGTYTSEDLEQLPSL